MTNNIARSHSAISSRLVTIAIIKQQQALGLPQTKINPETWIIVA